MESTDSSAGSQLPPGFRFHPTDEELVVHYLKKKTTSSPLPVSIIADVDIYKFDPWELPGKAVFGEQEWYFFTPRERKYPNGARPNRAATSGYWKATGTDKPVLTAAGTQKVGVKKALVFYGGKPPKGIKTNWIMHEYRLAQNHSNLRPPGCDFTNKKASSLRVLDDWVLCRIYKKSCRSQRQGIDEERDDDVDGMIGHGHKLVEHDDHMSMLYQVQGTTTSLSPSTTTAAVVPQLPSFCWISDNNENPPATTNGNGNGNGNGTTMSTVLNQMPQTPLAEQVFGQHVLGINCYSSSTYCNF